MIIKIFRNNYFKIFTIIFISYLIDNLLISSINNPPAWDQGYHLSNVFKMYNILEDKNIFLFKKFDKLLDITDSYRGPITYLISALFLKITKNNYYFAYLSNQVFNIICIFSIFHLGKILKNEATGLWASILFTFSTLIVSHRSDFLIDLSLTSFSTLCLLSLTKWYLDNNNNISKYSLFSGFTLGLIFLTKPTGIILFFFPCLVIFIKRFINKNSPILYLNEIIIFLSSFIIFIYPWFSRHWLTIITSTINAWNWGVNYQVGIRYNSIKNWFFYFYKLPSILGFITSSILSVIFILEKFLDKNTFKLRINNIGMVNLWFFIYFFNTYLILSLMSTKDIRFLMPSYPLICIYLSIFINQKSCIFTPIIKKRILLISIILSLFFQNGLNFNILNKNKFYKWPHSEIIKEIKNKNKNLISTLAVLPDIKHLNTFNLEAEASKLGGNVLVRQVISNKKTYKEDLKYFDWFLVKTGQQGIMWNDSKKLLNNYLLNNNSFIVQKTWIMPDKSKLMLLRRKLLSTDLSQINCANKYPIFKIAQISNGLNIKLFIDGKSLSNSNLLIDLNSKDSDIKSDISLANGYFHNSFDINKCYLLDQNFSIDLSNNFQKSYRVEGRLISNDGNIKTLDISNKNLIIDKKLNEGNYIQMVNRISKVELLGKHLRKGEFKNLFNLVGIINQSDPNQIYLRDAEKIYLQRYKENNQLKDLYSILISQILQRKVIEAEETINLILKEDKNNGNLFIAKSIINLYSFNLKELKININNIKMSGISKESAEILKILEGINYFLEMKFINAYKSFS